MGHRLEVVTQRGCAPEPATTSDLIDGATFLHHSTISDETLTPYRADTLFVVYCAGPHCNAADKAAANLARLGRPVKKMIGGTTGWLDEGFELTATNHLGPQREERNGGVATR